MPSEKDCSGSPPSESRKNSKPVMEKRRRARINASLCELKSLLLEVMKKEGTRHNKMEKADILEMTVKHLRQIQRQQFAVAATADPTVVTKYQSGFVECAHEVTRYLSSVDGVDAELKSRMLNHLANSIQGVVGGTDDVTSTTGTGNVHVNIAPKTVIKGGGGFISTTAKQQPQTILLTGIDVNNNASTNVIVGTVPNTATMPITAYSQTGSQQKLTVPGVQLVPTRLPSGEVAFLLPGNLMPATGAGCGAAGTAAVPTSYMIPVYNTATTSTPLSNGPKVATSPDNRPSSSVSPQATEGSHDVIASVPGTTGSPVAKMNIALADNGSDVPSMNIPIAVPRALPLNTSQKVETTGIYPAHEMCEIVGNKELVPFRQALPQPVNLSSSNSRVPPTERFGPGLDELGGIGVEKGQNRPDVMVERSGLAPGAEDNVWRPW